VFVRKRLAVLVVLIAATGVAALPSPAGASSYPVRYTVFAANPAPDASPLGANNFACKPSAAHPDPVVLVHGLGATMGENWNTMSPLLANHGYCVFALTYGRVADDCCVGGLVRMEDSSAELAAFVDKVLAATGASKVDLVGHSEGTVMPQYYLKFRGGAAKVAKYVAITPLYHGTTLQGLGPLISAMEKAYPTLAQPISAAFDKYCGSCQEFLAGSPFYQHLYADGVYAVAGIQYTAIMTRYDELVTPYTSGRLDAPNATNVVVQDQCPIDLAEHVAVAFDPIVGQDILNALDPAHPQPVPCRPVLPILGAPLG
jgi:pimeloyl-ACP methyl ester carboxylesterase